MSYRFTNTEKWGDAWFSKLDKAQMLLFIYLCDNCDIAGFIEINCKRWAVDMNTTQPIIEGALKGLRRGFVLSKESDCLYLRNFLKHQKNLPLNNNNKAHVGIIRRFESYAHKFGIEDINEFIKGASEGLQSPTGNGTGIGIGIGTGEEPDFLDQIIDQFVGSTGGEYVVLNRGKERAAAGKLVGLHRKMYPEDKSEDTLRGLRTYFDECNQISDNWLQSNMSLSLMVSKFNEINKILKNGNKRKTGGATAADIAALFPGLKNG